MNRTLIPKSFFPFLVREIVDLCNYRGFDVAIHKNVRSRSPRKLKGPERFHVLHATFILDNDRASSSLPFFLFFSFFLLPLQHARYNYTNEIRVRGKSKLAQQWLLACVRSLQDSHVKVVSIFK